MPRELAIFGVLIPTLLPLFCASIVLQAVLDRILGRLGLYAMLWHPSLVRLCLFTGIFGALVLTLYQ
ncbi:DUF1656 domain-containing protein [Janthinobacterium agaricidamnosum]|uniref:DUF1656 domain-containing protein n=1 Tax=Janthinobacterium agaricidamnosum NBRC 102515 = DSM 9628 TaxID=1349767 RepID=W0VBJ7_9BURK|nr:DUF1656 domain-containing protein [Janthinobacterium agaricidamnosum]CDG84662.1 conserved hypothetical protein [Janthinobacterium agaricidamnosum NBRC 102515 = DSM 9628]